MARASVADMHRRDIDLRIEGIYGFAMPDSLFAFWDFACTATLPLLRDAAGIIALEGPFEWLGTAAPDEHDPLWRARYYNDPPEFLTLLTGLSDGLHWGYYLDEPGQPDLPVASYHHDDAFQISVTGADLFEATRLELEYHYRDQCEDLAADAAGAGAGNAAFQKQETVRSLLKQYATADRREQGADYIDAHGAPSLRRTAAPTRDDMGIVVPAASYRALVRCDDGSFGIAGSPQPGSSPAADDPFQAWNYLPGAAEVEAMTAAALEAAGAGFPGTALKLGKDLWTYGNAFEAPSGRLLEAAYDALDRPLLRRYLDIARRHRRWCDARPQR